MTTPRELEQWLQEGIAAAKAGRFEQARFRLLDVVEQNQTNEVAWYWLYQVFDHTEDRRTCLENLIIINPRNQWAKQELLNLLDSSAAVAPQPPPSADRAAHSKKKAKPAAPPISLPRPITLKLVTAFWFGISIFLLGGGIISTGEWLFASLYSRNTLFNPTPFQLLQLLISIVFIVVGFLGINVAIGLFLRSMLGFYGSILLALGLLLVGPTVSLITNPPNYIAMTCTGGIAGMMVLLTLASQPGFKNEPHDGNASL